MSRMPRLARAGTVFCAAAAVTLAQLNLPSHKFWEGKPILLYAGAAILSITTAGEALTSLRDVRQAAAVRKYEKDLRAALSATLLAYVRKYNVHWGRIGVHAFLAKRSGVRLRMINVGGVRLGSSPSMAAPVWRPGKGVVGLAFSTREVEAVDWQEFYTTARAEGAKKWDARSKAQRYGLSWGELELTGEYQRIIAYPLFNPKGNQIGVITVDASIPLQQLVSAESQDILRNLAASIVALGTPPAAWWGYTR